MKRLLTVNNSPTFEETSSSLTIEGKHIHYHEAGEGPILILLHGGAPGVSAWSNFKYNLAYLSQRFRCVAVDMPGFGRSHQPHFEEHFFSYASRWVLKVMDNLGIEKAHFLGNSLGGGVATRLALDAPERASRLILMGPGGLALNIFYPGLSEGLKSVRDFYRGEGASRNKMKEFIKIMTFDQRAWVSDELIDERFKAASDAESMEGVIHTLETIRSKDYWRDGELWRELERIRSKTLLIWGRDDKTMPMDGALFALRRIPDVQLHIFGRCGHWVQMEQADAFNHVVSAFLESQ